MPRERPQKNVPVIFFVEGAAARLDSVREFVRKIYFISPFDSPFKEFVLAFSARKDTVWVWMILRSAASDLLKEIGERAQEAKIGWIDLSHQTEEEKERHRETVVKYQESYEVFSKEDIDSLFSLIQERMPTHERPIAS